MTQTNKILTPFLGLLAVLTLLLAVGCASTQPAGEQLDDAGITAKIKSKLATDGDINPFKIDVDTNEGVVRLSGTVEKESTRREAGRLARETSGVRRVVNEITLGERTAGERVDDAGLVAKVKAKLTADPEINPFNIDVDAKDGVITLSGRVNNQAEKDEAEQLARNTDGVRDVRNDLKVGDRTGG